MIGRRQNSAAYTPALACTLLALTFWSGHCEKLRPSAKLLKRADRGNAPTPAELWREDVGRPQRTLKTLEESHNFSGAAAPDAAALFTRAINEDGSGAYSSFATLAPYPSNMATAAPAPANSAKIQATAEQCDIFTQTSVIACNNALYSDLPEFACCVSIKDGSTCMTTATGMGTACSAPLLPACCFARNQPVAACTQPKSSAGDCGGNYVVTACCTDTNCKVNRYAKTISCSSSEAEGCCPA